MDNASEILKKWYDSQPANFQPYIKNRLLETFGWTLDIFYNKMTRTLPTIAEQRLINQIVNERIFEVPEIPVIIDSD